MNARLVDFGGCVTSGSSCKEIVLSRFPILVGRGEQVDLRLGDPWVSRCHCSIETRDGVLIVRDLGSKHGTWVNHRRVEESAIMPGDELEIGLTTLRAEYEVHTCEVH